MSMLKRALTFNDSNIFDKVLDEKRSPTRWRRDRIRRIIKDDCIENDVLLPNVIPT
jgi:hypothetical protein